MIKILPGRTFAPPRTKSWSRTRKCVLGLLVGVFCVWLVAIVRVLSRFHVDLNAQLRDRAEVANDSKPTDTTSPPRVEDVIVAQEESNPVQKDARYVVEYFSRSPHFDASITSPIDSLANKGKEVRYITFEDDAGGWNNIRMAFECYVNVARFTNRVLVLPPIAKFYLLDYGPIQAFDKSKVREQDRTSPYWDYYDFKILKSSGIKIISTSEFLREYFDARQIALPSDIRTDALKTGYHNGYHSSWFLYLRDRPDAEIWPPGPGTEGPFGLETLEDLRKVIMDRKPILHFPVHLSKGYRYLDGVPRLVMYAHPDIKRFAKVFTRNHLVYSKDIRERAIKSVTEGLGGLATYACFHIRRNELQYKSSFLAAEASLRNSKFMLKPNETLYIATDETEKDFFMAFEKAGHRVVRLQDIPMGSGKGRQHKFDGMVEQMICSMARAFVGTSTSTFSSYINRLRGYMWKDIGEHSNVRNIQVDLGCYFHDSDLGTNSKQSTHCRSAPFSALDASFVP